MKRALLLFLIISLSVSCANPIRKETSSDGLHSQVVMNYDAAAVEKAMEVKGIKYTPMTSEQGWILEGVAPANYRVGSSKASSPPEEKASVYIFASEEARKKGLRDFRKQTERYNMAFPLIFERRNVLILYWSHGNRDATAPLEEKFTNVMSSLRMIAEFRQSSTGLKEIPYTILIGAGRTGGIRFERGAAIQSIDTHQNGRVHSVQIRGWRLPSAIAVEYKGRNVLVEYTESSSSARENVFVLLRDDELEPKRIQFYVNGRKQRIAGIEHGME
jgi:hypothetical protein